MRTLRPLHAALILLCGFVAGQILGGALALAGIGIAVATGGLDAESFTTAEGLASVMAHPLVLVPSAVGSSLGFLAVAIGAPIVLRVPVRDALAIRPASRVAWVLGPLGALGFAVAVDQVVFYFGELFPGVTLGTLGAFARAAQAPGALLAVVIFVATAIIPGTCEELFFRGAFQSALVSRWRPAAAIGMTSFVFGAIHLDPPQALGAGLLAVYLGWLTMVTRSVGPAIASHITNNGVAFLSANVQELSEVGYGADTPVPWPAVAGGLAVAAACVFAITTRTAPRHAPA